MNNEGLYDGMFEQILQQNQGIDGFWAQVFSFLRRRSDFFANQKLAEEIIVKHCRKNFLEFDEQKKKEAQKALEKKEREEKRKQQQQTEDKSKFDAEKLQKEKEEKERRDKEEQAKKALEKKETEEKKEENGEKKAEDDDDKGPVPVGNGGTTDKYTWTQTLEELHCYIPINSNLKAKDFVVKLEQTRLFIGEKNKEPILNGEWFDKIEIDNSLWTIETTESGKHIHLSLEKPKYTTTWWDCVLKGEPKINTKKINPEPSKLSELDGEMRGTVEKMMFDMRQKQMGLPSSDELQKKDKLSEFMKAHPEMDFSKCKFN